MNVKRLALASALALALSVPVASSAATTPGTGNDLSMFIVERVTTTYYGDGTHTVQICSRFRRSLFSLRRPSTGGLFCTITGRLR